MLIHVTCPNCSEPYDIADTFAGGVYRCTKCNTLMSVPKKHTPPAATLTAPGMSKAASPDAIESRGSSKPVSASASRNATKPGAKPAARPGTKPGAKAAAKPTGLAAYKWHLASFGALIVVALLVFIIVKATKGKTEVVETVKPVNIAARPVSNYFFKYATGVLVNDKPNVLGLPLSGTVAVVVDGGSELNGVRPALHKLLVAGLTGKPYEKPSASFVYANGEKGDKVPFLKAAPVNSPDGAKNADAFLSGVSLANSLRDDAVVALKSGLQTAVDQIVLYRTSHIVLVVGRPLTPYAQNQLLGVMEKAFGTYHTHFDIVVVDANAADMKDLSDMATSSQGFTMQTSATALQNAASTLK